MFSQPSSTTPPVSKYSKYAGTQTYFGGQTASAAGPTHAGFPDHTEPA